MALGTVTIHRDPDGKLFLESPAWPEELEFSYELIESAKDTCMAYDREAKLIFITLENARASYRVEKDEFHRAVYVTRLVEGSITPPPDSQK